MDVLFFLILGHFCGDYALQSDHVAQKKKTSKSLLSFHVLTYILCLWLFLAIYSLIYQPGLYLDTAVLVFLTVIYIEHWIQDFIKSKIKRFDKQLYYADQLLHIILLYIYRIFIYKP